MSDREPHSGHAHYVAHHTIRGAAKRRARADETSALFKAHCWRERALVYNRDVAVSASTLASLAKYLSDANMRPWHIKSDLAAFTACTRVIPVR